MIGRRKPQPARVLPTPEPPDLLAESGDRQRGALWAGTDPANRTIYGRQLPDPRWPDRWVFGPGPSEFSSLTDD